MKGGSVTSQRIGKRTLTASKSVFAKTGSRAASRAATGTGEAEAKWNDAYELWPGDYPGAQPTQCGECCNDVEHSELCSVHAFGRVYCFGVLEGARGALWEDGEAN